MCMTRDFPTPPSNSQTPTGGLTIQLNSDTTYPELASDTKVWSLSQEDALEKGMATNSSILA